MQVNIGGRGRIPLIGHVAPLRNYEIDHYLATNMLRYSAKYPMYESETGIMITPSNINGLFNGNRKLDMNDTIQCHKNTIQKAPNKNKETQTEKETMVVTENTEVTPVIFPGNTILEHEENENSQTNIQQDEITEDYEVIEKEEVLIEETNVDNNVEETIESEIENEIKDHKPQMVTTNNDKSNYKNGHNKKGKGGYNKNTSNKNNNGGR